MAVAGHPGKKPGSALVQGTAVASDDDGSVADSLGPGLSAESVDPGPRIQWIPAFAGIRDHDFVAIAS